MFPLAFPAAFPPGFPGAFGSVPCDPPSLVELELFPGFATGAGGLFSVLFDPRFSEAQTDRFIDSLKLFKIGYSWGGANSLAVPYRMAAIRKQWDHPGQLVRLNIGLEDTRDLIADLEQALGKC